MKTPNVFISVPCSLFAIELVLIILRFTDRTSSDSLMMPNQWLILPNIIICAIDFISVGLLNWLICSRLQSYKSRVVVFSIFTTYMLFSIIIFFGDYLNLRETLQQFTKYYFATYVTHLKSMFNTEMKITGLSEKDGNAQMFGNLINRSPIPWAVIFVTIIVVLLVHVFTIVNNCSQKCEKKKMYKEINSDHSESPNTLQTANNSFDNVPLIIEVNQVSKKHSDIPAIVTVILVFALEFVLFISCMASSDKHLQVVAPSHWNFFRTGAKNKLNKQKYQEAVKQFRQSNELMTEYDWIDQRTIPEFPMVYAPKKYVCAYNPELQYCSSLPKDERKIQEEAPNVVFIVVESFSPSPMMFQNHIVASNDKIVDGPLYKDTYLPNLRKISENALTFSSLSSSGLPTLYGWLSLMTGEIPYSNQINIVQSMLNDVDDFPSYFQQNGYDTMYVAPCKFDFDGQHIWLFRGKEVRNKKHPQLKEMPLWFDNVYQYIPTQEQAKELNVTQNYLQSWVPDRITAAQFMKHFDENKKQGKPLMGVWVTIDTHQAFQGFDNDEFYEPFKFGQGRYGSQQLQDQINRYATVAKYMDNYVGQVVNHLKEKHNNTIVVLVGDHGAREVPLFHKNLVDRADPTSAKYDNSCNDEPFSNDELFATSGAITYLGDNRYLKSLFEPVIGKVVKVPTDHHDMIRTLYDIVGAHTGMNLPSSRNGRNLIELATNLTQSKPLRRHLSLRTTMVHSEMATEDTVFRFHSIGAYGQKFPGIYPTCVSPGEVREPITKSQFRNFDLYHRLYDHVQISNKQFSYKFRNQACQYPAVCDFPESFKAFSRNDVAIITFSVLGFGLLIGLIIVLIIYVVEKCQKKNTFNN
ncbi:Sulfatase [Hexamita inflata]|uniref:Sulfatase n=1 Tax=Hexamita inflata TaxID=28002 RepID=A0AA86UVV4_9EUKA|nr:Sulfatase [Hexamita inflata]